MAMRNLLWENEREQEAPVRLLGPVVAFDNRSEDGPEDGYADERGLRGGTPVWFVLADATAIGAALMLTGQSRWATLVTIVIHVTLCGLAGLYRSRLYLSALDDMAAVLGRFTIASSLTYVLSAQGTGTLSLLSGDFGRPWWIGVGLSGAALLAARALAYALVRRARAAGLVRHRTLIVGAGQVGTELASILREYPEFGLEPVAFHDPDPPQDASPDLPLYRTASIGASIRATGASVVVVAFASLPDDVLVEYLQYYQREEAEFFFVPRLFELDSAGRHVDYVRSIPLLRLRRSVHRSVQWKIKGLLDRLLSAVLLILISPLFLAIALAVLVTSGRPVIFRQERVGLDGRCFSILKFRSLPPTDDSVSDTQWAAERQRQPDWLGSLLRKTSLDEIPQLVNIVKGEMSFVGPRPERPHFAGRFAETNRRYSSRHRVPTGLTGLAQVSGLRGDTSIEQRTQMDNVYVETWSLWEDLKILIRTIPLLLPKRER